MALPPPTRATVDVADRVANSAAPMLAGLIGALIGLVGASTQDIRWPGPTLAALTLAVLLLLASMQAWIRGQSYFVTSDEISERVVARARHRALERSTAYYRLWIQRSQVAFQVGVSLFLVGLAFVVLPQDSSAGEAWRWAAAALTAAVAVVGGAVIVRMEWRDAKWRNEVKRLSESE